MSESLPDGMTYEWTDLKFQEKRVGNTSIYIFALAVLLAFLFLAAQYNSWSLPFAVLLIAPMALLSAIAGVWLTGGDNNIFTQIGFVVLVGLAAKNAILIVEFARAKESEGVDPLAAVLSGAAAAAPDSDDVTGFYRWRDTAGAREWSGCRDASRNGYRCVRRHVGRDGIRSGAHAGVLRRSAQAGVAS